MSTAPKYSQGPYRYDEDGFIYNAEGHIVSDPHSSPDVDIDEREANAVLFTAAPTLAGLLAETISYVEEAEQFHKPTARELSKKIKTILAEIGHPV